MAHTLPELPYPNNALEPYISAETLEFHYGKHHRTYVDKLNELVKGSDFADASLEEIIRHAPPGGVFNNGAQVWNHTFYWHCLSPNRSEPRGELLNALTASFGSVENFRKTFSDQAAGLFGSGWTWLVRNDDGSLAILPLSNAENPLRNGQTPILTCDVWEHAYYIDYRNARPQYLEAFWNIVNWDFVARNFA